MADLNRLLEALRPPHMARVPMEPPVSAISTSSREQLQPGGRYGILRSVGRWWVLFRLHYYSVPIGLVLSPGLYTTAPNAVLSSRTEAEAQASSLAVSFPCALANPGHPNLPLPLPLSLAQVLRPNSLTPVFPANLTLPVFGAPLLFVQRLRPAELAAVGIQSATELLFFARGEGLVADPQQLSYEAGSGSSAGESVQGYDYVPEGGGVGQVRVGQVAGGWWLAQDALGPLTVGRTPERTVEVAQQLVPDGDFWLELPHKRRHLNARPKLRRLTADGTPPWHVSPREYNEVPAWL